MQAAEATFEPAHPDDEPALVPLMLEFNRSENIAWRPEAMRAALHRLLREPALGLVLVARERGSRRLAGYAIATFGYDLEFAGRDAFVTELFVAPPFRGMGVGRALLTHTVEALQKEQTHAVHLMVTPENERARALYSTLGFVVSPRTMMTREL